MWFRENFHLIEQIVVNYDIFTISETWLDPSVYDSDLNIPGYILIRQERGAQKKGGGLIVYAKSKFKVSVLDTWSSVSEYNFQQLFNCLFLEALNDHAPIKRIKIKSKPNPFISPEIKQLMNTCDAWHKSPIKSGDKLHWNAYRFFRQEVKREIRLAEIEHVRSEL